MSEAEKTTPPGDPATGTLDPAKGADQQWPAEANVLPSEYLGDENAKPA